MKQGRCTRNSKEGDQELQLEASKQIAALRNIQREAEMRQQDVEHENKIGDLERRVLDLGRNEAQDTDQKQDKTIKDLEDQVLKVQDVTMELAKRANEQNALLQELALHRPVTLPHDEPLHMEAPRLKRVSTLPVNNGLHLATIVPKGEIQPQPLEPMAIQQALPVPPLVQHDLDVSKYSIAHIESESS
jgi:hypothetical protein